MLLLGISLDSPSLLDTIGLNSLAVIKMSGLEHVKHQVLYGPHVLQTLKKLSRVGVEVLGVGCLTAFHIA